MVKSNEFTAATLAGAVKKATAAYDRGACDVKSQRQCNDLVLEISSLKSEIGRIGDEADRLADEADRLRESAIIQLGLAALTALSSLSGALRALRIISRRLKNKDPKKLTERDIIDLLSALGPLGAAIGAIYAAAQLREAQQLARKAEQIERNGEGLGNDLLAAVREYSRLGCGETDRFIS